MAVTINGTTNVITPTSAVQPTGSLLQVVSTVKKDTFSESVAANGDTAVIMTATITPASTSNKILVWYSLSPNRYGNYMTLTRGGSTLTAAIGDAAGSRVRSTNTQVEGNDSYTATLSGHFLDSPSSTSALTYGFKLRHSSSSTQTIYLNRGTADTDEYQVTRGISVFTVMEIAG